jgi:hypothetical protein
MLSRFTTVLRLRAFDCRCRRLSDEERPLHSSPVATPMTDGAETASPFFDIIDALSDEEREMLVRHAVGFSDRELYDTYGRAVDLEELVSRVVARVRS